SSSANWTVHPCGGNGLDVMHICRCCASGARLHEYGPGSGCFGGGVGDSFHVVLWLCVDRPVSFRGTSLGAEESKPVEQKRQHEEGDDDPFEHFHAAGGGLVGKNLIHAFKGLKPAQDRVIPIIKMETGGD